MDVEWTVAYSHDETGAFHSADPRPRRSATFHTVSRPVLVLGSTQPDASVDHRVADALGVEVVRRRSGGGAVLLLPDEFVWLDLVIAADDPLWLDDVGEAMVWVGELWQAALADLGMQTDVHRGGLRASQWSRQVCFSGVGSGEVLCGTSKVVGISQRRTRTWARFQSMCHLRWRPEIVAALVAAPRPSAAAIAPVAQAAAVDVESLRHLLIAGLP